MKGRFIDAVQHWLKNNRPTIKKAKSLGMTQEQYTHEYLTLLQMKIEQEEKDLPVWSTHPRYLAQMKHNIKVLKKEQQKKAYKLFIGGTK